MSVDLQQIEALITEIEKLSPALRLQLVQRVLHSLPPEGPSDRSAILRFGEFAGEDANMSTDEDFAMAEWRLGK
jgi:hypothetical protein